ncbi:MAG: hypothetical protein RIE73_28440 [Coleofasciculus sp. C1-SOL-03]|uniref:hypothetical protein n=1 Tax=Coleofasciculus sp. C1-SOL-03 TaxID=3069522 RepID=UPI003304F901
MAHLNWWIRIVGAHGVRPISPPNLSHNFSCISPLLAWHTLFDELELRPETVGAHGVRPIQ